MKCPGALDRVFVKLEETSRYSWLPEAPGFNPAERTGGDEHAFTDSGIKGGQPYFWIDVSGAIIALGGKSRSPFCWTSSAALAQRLGCCNFGWHESLDVETLPPSDSMRIRE